ncbi:MAG: hypothetical protein AAF657_21745 [Acidobacteriota bacterium]
MPRELCSDETLACFVETAALQAVRVQREYLDRTHWDRSTTASAPVDDNRATGNQATSHQATGDPSHSETEAQQQAVHRFAQALAQAGSELPEVVRALAPRPLDLQHFELEAQVHFTVRREHGFALAVTPLGLGVERRYGESLSNSSTIRIEVESVPNPGSQTSTPTE